MKRASVIHLRVNRDYGIQTFTGTACKVQLWSWKDSSRNPAEVTCKTCKKTKAYKEHEDRPLTQAS